MNECGFDAVLPKPFTNDSVNTLIENLVFGKGGTPLNHVKARAGSSAQQQSTAAAKGRRHSATQPTTNGNGASRDEPSKSAR